MLTQQQINLNKMGGMGANRSMASLAKMQGMGDMLSWPKGQMNIQNSRFIFIFKYCSFGITAVKGLHIISTVARGHMISICKYDNTYGTSLILHYNVCIYS